MSGTIHIIGAGLSGLAAAVVLAARGRPVVVHEAAGQAGGRCRSFHDDKLDRRIDNGNHLILSGNRAIFAYLETIGAGLSGLAAAVALAAKGRPVVVHEAAGQAGGRCRSFHDDKLDRRIDNGNHLILSGNRAIFAYLETVGARDGFVGPARAEFPFVDVASGERWTVRPGRARVPWWLAQRGRRVPGSGFGDYLKGLRLAFAGPERTVAACLADTGVLYQRFWEPLAVSVLNTSAEEAAARLLWPVLVETFGRGEAACRPRVARLGLSESLIDPAVAWLTRQGATLHFGQRLRRLAFTGDRVAALVFADGASVTLGAADQVVLAVPALVASALVPDLTAPTETRAIVNAHFRLTSPPTAPVPLGVVGGLAHWIFVRGDVASVTVSAADDLARHDADAIAARLWPEVRSALGLSETVPQTSRIIKEKRATFAQTPAQVARRPGARTAWRNLFLAGDWTATGLPATIEGSVRSGNTAAAAIVS